MRSASQVPELLNAVGQTALIVNRDPLNWLALADTIPELSQPGIILRPGEMAGYDLTRDRAIKAALNPAPLLTLPPTTYTCAYDLFPGGESYTPAVNGILLGELIVGPMGNASATLTVPNGVTVIGAFVQGQPGATFTITGATTGYVVLNPSANLTLGGKYFQGPVPPGVDSQVTAAYTNGNPNFYSAWVFGYTGMLGSAGPS